MVLLNWDLCCFSLKSPVSKILLIFFVVPKAQHNCVSCRHKDSVSNIVQILEIGPLSLQNPRPRFQVFSATHVQSSDRGLRVSGK